MLKPLFDRNGMRLYICTVSKIEEGTTQNGNKYAKLGVVDVFDKKDTSEQTVTFWNSSQNPDQSAQRADRVKKMKIQEGSQISLLAYKNEDGTFNGIDLKYINGVWNFKATAEEKERNIVFARLIPGKYKEGDRSSNCSFPEYNFSKKTDEWSNIAFFNNGEDLLGTDTASMMMLGDGEKYKKAVVLCNPAYFTAYKKLEDGTYDNKKCDDTFTVEEAQKQGYTIKKCYNALKRPILVTA